MTLGRLRFAAEPPSNFQEEKASHPLCYQFDRWMFLRAGEKCRIDGPCVRAVSNSIRRSVPRGRTATAAREAGLSVATTTTAENGWGNRAWPMGVVDLCPCVKLTPGTRQRLRGYLRGAGAFPRMQRSLLPGGINAARSMEISRFRSHSTRLSVRTGTSVL
jgi:hypothetical protein